MRAHAAVAHRRRAARVRRRHAAERRVGARVDREPEPVRPRGRLELRPRHAGLDGRREVVGAQRDDRVHPRQVEADAAVQRDHVAFEARAGAERHDGHAGGVRIREHGRHLLGRLREDDDVGAVRRVIREVGGVLVEHRLAVADAALVRNEPEQLRTEVGGDRHETKPRRLVVRTPALLGSSVRRGAMDEAWFTGCAPTSWLGACSTPRPCAEACEKLLEPLQRTRRSRGVKARRRCGRSAPRGASARVLHRADRPAAAARARAACRLCRESARPTRADARSRRARRREQRLRDAAAAARRAASTRCSGVARSRVRRLVDATHGSC